MTPIWESRKMWGKFEKGAGKYLPANILGIAAVVERAGYEILVYDAASFGREDEHLAAYLNEHQFAVVGITSYTASILNAYHTVEVIRRTLPKTQIIMGGMHATLLPERTLKECKELDAVCIGEGEETFLEYIGHHLKKQPPDLSAIAGLAYRKNGEMVRTTPRAPIKNLSWLPMPAYHLVPMEEYILPAANYYRLPSYSMYVSRGCAFKCSFCNSWTVHGPGGAGYRPLEQVMDEVRHLVSKYGARGIYFYDGTFSANHKWVREFCRRLIDERIRIHWSCLDRCNTIDLETARLMKAAGCWKVTLGIESANQKTLDLLNKHYTIPIIEKAVSILNRVGIQIAGSFILAMPGEDEEDVRRTIDFANRLKLHTAMYFIPIPMPQTKLMEDCVKDGGIVGDVDDWKNYGTFNLDNPLYVNPRLGKERMIELYNFAYRRTYSNPRIILRNFLSMRSWTDVKRNFRGFLAVKEFLMQWLGKASKE